MFILLFGIRPLAMVITGETRYYRGIEIINTLPYALLISVLGSTTFLAGYAINVPLRRFSKNRLIQLTSFSKVKIILIVIGAIIVGSSLFLIYLGESPVHTLFILSQGLSKDASNSVSVHSEYLYDALLLFPCAATILIISQGRQRLHVRHILLIFILITIPVVIYYILGARRFIIPSFMVPVTSYFLTKKTRPHLSLILLGIPVLLILAALPYMRTAGARSSIGGFGDQILYAFSHSGILKKIALGPDTEMLSSFSVEVKTLQSSQDFYFGRATVGDLLIAPIPSAAFPKPMSARNSMLIKAFGIPCDANPGGLCPDFSIIGTFYQDFWIFGVALDMLVLGYFTRQIWECYRLLPNNPKFIAMSSIWFVFLPIIIRAGFMPAFQWSLYFFIPILIGLKFVYKTYTFYIVENSSNVKI